MIAGGFETNKKGEVSIFIKRQLADFESFRKIDKMTLDNDA